MSFLRYLNILKFFKYCSIEKSFFEKFDTMSENFEIYFLGVLIKIVSNLTTLIISLGFQSKNQCSKILPLCSKISKFGRSSHSNNFKFNAFRHFNEFPIKKSIFEKYAIIFEIFENDFFR